MHDEEAAHADEARGDHLLAVLHEAVGYIPVRHPAVAHLGIEVLTKLLFVQGSPTLEVDAELPVVGVVYGDVPVYVEAVHALGVRRHVGVDEVGHAHVARSVAAVAHGEYAQSKEGLLHFDRRAHVVGEVGVGGAGAAHDRARPLVLAEEAVEVGEVHGVYVALVALQVVAGGEDLGRKDGLHRSRQELVGGDQRRLAGAHVGEDEVACFHARVGGVPDLLLESAALRLAGLFEAVAVDVVQPAVVQAAQPAVLDAPVAQVGGAVRAVDTEQAELAVLVAEEREVFAEDPHVQGSAAGWQLLSEGDRVPVAAEHLAARRARPCLG